jgi:predicted ATPase/class 3 adenylate cyclase
MDTVRCPSCGEENPSRFRLCGFCGTSLAPPETISCPSCGEENPGKFRLCGFCGTPLASGAAGAPAPFGGAAPAPFGGAPAGPAAPVTPPAILPSAEVRKPATFIFVDLKGSTALTERIDQEAMSEIKRTYFTAMATQIERHGGTIEKYIGDAIMAVFGIPKAHEDDALRAVRAAHGMQQELSRLNAEFLPFYGVELANRTGVNTGEVVANTDPSANQQLATGDTVNVAARLEQAAPANEILIGETTYDLVRAHVDVEPVEPLELKGKAERVPAYRLLAVRDATVEGAHLARRSPLVGRTAEMAQIRAAFRAVVAEGGCRLITLVGEAGVGKSRLLDDMHEEVAAEATVVHGRCLPYGDGITFWPIVEVVRDAARIAADDAPDVARGRIADLLAGSPEADQILDRLSSVIGLSASRYPVAEIFWAARKLLEVLAAERPVLVLFEDIHYAEPTFLELLEHLVETLPDHASVLILCAARLLLLEKRADWSTADRMSRLQLPALTDTDTGELVGALLGAPVAAGVRSRIVTATEGNPLFTEQLVSMLVDKGHIRRTEAGWQPVDDVATLAVPPTIQALLAARLDDLSREERATIEPAAVIGLVFPQPAVAELVPEAVRPFVPANLSALDRKQLLQREGTMDTEDEAYRFRNLLIRDATYGSLLKRARAQMHERFVTWAERVNRERGREEEFEEILGYHLEQAYRYRTELGPLDAEGRTLAARAAIKLGNAGRRAFARGDLPAAASLLRRTVALLDPADPARIENQAELGEVLLEAGDFAEATAVLDIAIAAAETIGDERLRARARLGRLGIALYAEELETGAAGRALDEATEAAALFEDRADDAGVARAWRLIGSIHATSGRYEAAADAAQRVVEHATRAGDRRLASRAAAGYATIARAGAMPADQVAERCGPLLDQVAGDRKAEAMILGVIAVSEAMQAQFDRARDRHARAKTILGELGRSIVAASTSIEGSRIEMLAGDHAAAEALLDADSRELDGMGERYFRSTVVGLLAHALEAQGRLDEADAAADLAAALTDEDDVESQMLWRTARAKVRAQQDRGDDALELAAEALALAAETDDIDVQGDVHADYATVFSRLGRTDEAVAHYRLARDLYARKGNVALAQVMTAALQGAGQPA